MRDNSKTLNISPLQTYYFHGLFLYYFGSVAEKTKIMVLLKHSCFFFTKFFFFYFDIFNENLYKNKLK